jgi:uncharacterized protein YjiS (DUF1127 family)
MFRNVLWVTSQNLNNGQCQNRNGIAGRFFWEQAMAFISLSKIATPTYRLRGWSKLEALLGEWWHRILSRYELESLSERDLADMGMTRTDAFNEVQKPFWQK